VSGSDNSNSPPPKVLHIRRRMQAQKLLQRKLALNKKERLHDLETELVRVAEYALELEERIEELEQKLSLVLQVLKRHTNTG
jgi:hypothetical protein